MERPDGRSGDWRREDDAAPSPRPVGTSNNLLLVTNGPCAVQGAGKGGAVSLGRRSTVDGRRECREEEYSVISLPFQNEHGDSVCGAQGTRWSVQGIFMLYIARRNMIRTRSGEDGKQLTFAPSSPRLMMLTPSYHDRV